MSLNMLIIRLGYHTCLEYSLIFFKLLCSVVYINKSIKLIAATCENPKSPNHIQSNTVKHDLSKVYPCLKKCKVKNVFF